MKVVESPNALGSLAGRGRGSTRSRGAARTSSGRVEGRIEAGRPRTQNPATASRRPPGAFRGDGMPLPTHSATRSWIKPGASMDAPVDQLAGAGLNTGAQAVPAAEVPAQPLAGLVAGHGHDRRATQILPIGIREPRLECGAAGGQDGVQRHAGRLGIGGGRDANAADRDVRHGARPGQSPTPLGRLYRLEPGIVVILSDPPPRDQASANVASTSIRRVGSLSWPVAGKCPGPG
jgi:hypothetical protein